MTDEFAHLHVHTEYSMLDGHAKHKEMGAELKRIGQKACAITDHGNMFGSYSFQKVMNEVGVKPIIGVEAYVAPGSRFHKKPIFWGKDGKRAKPDVDGESGDVSGGGAYTHMTLLARNSVGLRQLYEATARGSIDGQYPEPKGRLDRDLLTEIIERDGQNIIASTGCPGGEIQTRLRLGQWNQALEAAAFYRDLFGAENYFLEIMDHGLAVEKRTRQDLLRLGQELGIKPLATNDSHYTVEGDAAAHDALLCVGVGKNIDDPNRFKFDGTGYYLKTADQMRKLFDDQVPGACDNTLLVASMVEDYKEIFGYRNRMPHFPVPDGFTEETYLWHLVREGVRERYGDNPDQTVWDRINYEMELIIRMGFAGYFLAIWDVCRFMRERGIRFAPRGSAAGSAVIYTLRVAPLDPLKYDLLFERFINPDRISPPDVDIDIDERRRGEVVRYVNEKYGEEHVSQIITFGRLKAREALKDSARILGLPYIAGERASKAVPPDIAGFGVSLSDIFNQDHERYAEGQVLRDLNRDDMDVAKAVETGKTIEGTIRKTGVHACGVMLSSEPLMGQVPLHWHKDNKTGKYFLLAGHEYPDLESMGLQKMDFLGLRNWTVVDDTIRSIKTNHGIDIDLEGSEFNDPEVYEMLGRGETFGVFQLEGGGMQSLLKLMKPTEFEDIMAVGALYRPGPMGMKSHTNYALRKNGKQDITPIHPELAEPLREVLAPTQGVICFQEQVMKVVQIVAGYSLGQADLLRKAMGKKKKEILDKEYIPFSDGMRSNGFSDEAIKALWNTLEPFALYAFNRCVSGETDIARLGRGSHDWPQTVGNVANRLHGREDYDGTGCRYCYNEKGRPISPWSRQCGACRSWRAKWKAAGGMNAAGRVGDRVLPVKITDVFRQGVKPLWKMTLANGMTLTSTMNHRHLTPNGWMQLRELAIGDQVSVMSGGEWNIESPRTDTGGSSNWIAKHGYRVAERSHGKAGPVLHGRSAEFRRNTKTLEWVCAYCGSTEGRLERAHLDGDPMNNAAENLAILCNSCHKKHDYANGGRVKMWRKGRAIDSSAIVSIKYVGEKMTYDVTVDSEDHSWVANGGIITHNSHTACYGALAYWTAWLKLYYPAEYMAALLTSVGDKKDKMALYLAECRRMGLTVLVPDVNESASEFVAKGKVIRFGLGSIADVGDGSVDAIIAGRRERPYESFLDFLTQVGPAACTKKAVIALIHAGAFDSFGVHRRALAVVHEQAVSVAADVKKAESQGAFDLFSVVEGPQGNAMEQAGIKVNPDEHAWSKNDRLAHERQRLGLYVSGHPLDDAAKALAAYRTESLADLVSSGRMEGNVQLSGIITDLHVRIAKASQMPMATFTLEDLDTSVRCVVFTKTYPIIQHMLANDQIVSIKGRLNDRDEEVNVMVDKMLVLDIQDGEIPVVINLKYSRIDEEFVNRLKEILLRYPGDRPTRLNVTRADGEADQYVLPGFTVAPGLDFVSEIKALLGSGALVA